MITFVDIYTWKFWKEIDIWYFSRLQNGFEWALNEKE